MKIAQKKKVPVTSLETEWHIMIGLLLFSFSIFSSFFFFFHSRILVLNKSFSTAPIYKADKGRAALVQLETGPPV